MAFAQELSKRFTVALLLAFIVSLIGCNSDERLAELGVSAEASGNSLGSVVPCGPTPPIETMATFIKTMKEMFQSLEDFDRLDVNSLKNVAGPYFWGGQGNKGFLTAEWNGTPVVVKIFSRDTRKQAQLLNQGRWMLAWNIVNLGPTFYGFTELANSAYAQYGEIGVVMKHLQVEGRVFSDRDVFEKLKPLPGLKFTRNSIQQLRDISTIYEKLKTYGVCVKADDAQFMTSPSGAIVPIDPEYFDYRECPLPSWMDAQYVYLEFAQYFEQFVVE